jgi:nitronate monooxygenase
MPPRWNENRLTAKLGIDYPIIQGSLGGLSSQTLTAAVSNFGGLGSFAAHSLTPGAITCTDVLAFLTSLVEKVSEITGPLVQWSAASREKQILK